MKKLIALLVITSAFITHAQTVILHSGFTVLSPTPTNVEFNVYFTNLTSVPVRAGIYDTDTTNGFRFSVVDVVKVGQPIPQPRLLSGPVRPVDSRIIGTNCVGIVRAHSYSKGVIIYTDGDLTTSIPVQ